MATLKPGEKFPQISLPTVEQGHWFLDQVAIENFLIIVTYRGKHCPICRRYLQGLNQMINEFTERNIEVLIVSSNDEELARQTFDEWQIDSLNVAYGLSIETARSLGLFISSGISDSEPDYFSEPGIFIIDKDHRLYASSIQTMPFARPSFKEILTAIDYAINTNYPARGEA